LPFFIDANTTLKLRDLHIKNYGLGKGGFVFTDKSSQIRMSNVSISLAQDILQTNGGIYVDGPTTFILT
jgi:hypothetical protein